MSEILNISPSCCYNSRAVGSAMLGKEGENILHKYLRTSPPTRHGIDYFLWVLISITTVIYFLEVLHFVDLLDHFYFSATKKGLLNLSTCFLCHPSLSSLLL